MKRLVLILGLVLSANAANAQAVVVSTCGSKTFAVGSTNYVTMNTQGYLCVSTTTRVVTTAPDREPEPAPEPKKREEK